MKKKFDVSMMTFAALMSGLNVVFILLSVYFPVLSLIVYIALPFGAALVMLKTDWKYALIYLAVSLLITGFISFQETLFYVFPSLVSGLLFGEMIKHKVHAFFILMVTSLINISLQSLSLLLINLIYNVNFLGVFCTFLNLDKDLFLSIYLAFFFLSGLIQMLLSYFIIESELPKFHYSVNEENTLFLPVLITDMVSLTCALVFSFFIPSLSYLFTALSIYSSVYLLNYVFAYGRRLFNYLTVVSYVISFIAIIFLLASGNKYNFNLYFMILSFDGVIISVILLIYIIFFRKENLNTVFIRQKGGENG